jgi:hypothetical protein
MFKGSARPLALVTWISRCSPRFSGVGSGATRRPIRTGPTSTHLSRPKLTESCQSAFWLQSRDAPCKCCGGGEVLISLRRRPLLEPNGLPAARGRTVRGAPARRVPATQGPSTDRYYARVSRRQRFRFSNSLSAKTQLAFPRRLATFNAMPQYDGDAQLPIPGTLQAFPALRVLQAPAHPNSLAERNRGSVLCR